MQGGNSVIFFLLVHLVLWLQNLTTEQDEQEEINRSQSGYDGSRSLTQIRILEPCELLQEDEFDRIGRAVTLFRDDQLGDVFLFFR